MRWGRGRTWEEAGRPAQGMLRPRAAPIWAGGPSFTLICSPASACGTEGLPSAMVPSLRDSALSPFLFDPLAVNSFPLSIHGQVQGPHLPLSKGHPPINQATRVPPCYLGVTPAVGNVPSISDSKLLYSCHTGRGWDSGRSASAH